MTCDFIQRSPINTRLIHPKKRTTDLKNRAKPTEGGEIETYGIINSQIYHFVFQNITKSEMTFLRKLMRKKKRKT